MPTLDNIFGANEVNNQPAKTSGSSLDNIFGSKNTIQPSTKNTQSTSVQQAVDSLPTSIPVKQTLGDKIKSKVSSIFKTSDLPQYIFHPLVATTAAIARPTVKKYAEPIEQKVLDKTFNTPTGQEATKFISEATKGSRIALSVPKAYGKTIYNILSGKQLNETNDLAAEFEKANKQWDEASANEKNSFVENAARGVLDSGLQSAIGALLNLVPAIGTPASAAYFTALSAEEQRQNQGKVSSITKLGIDVGLDEVLGGVIKGIFKKPVKDLVTQGFKETAKQVLKDTAKGFVVEGGTEPAQTFLKFADSYKRAQTDEERQQVIADAKDYVQNGGLLMEFVVGGLTGGITAGGVSMAAGGQKSEPVYSILPEDDSNFTPPQNKMRSSIRESIQQDIDAGKPMEQVVQELIEGTKLPINVAQDIVNDVMSQGAPVVSTETIPGKLNAENLQALAQEIQTPPKSNPETKKAVDEIAAKFNKKEIEPVTDVNQLEEEAKKYKSAEEFIKAQGETIYHGTSGKFETFDEKMKGSVTGAKSAHGATWFTDSPEVAKAYSIYAAEAGPVNKILRQIEETEKIAKKSGAESDWAKYDELVVESEKLDTYDANFERRKLANVKEVVANGDFYTVDAKGKTPQELSSDGDIDSWLNVQVEKAKALGKDGIIIKNIDDAVGLYDKPSTHYAIFDSKNIKTKSQLTDIYNKANNIEPKFNEKGRTKLKEVPAEPERVKGYKQRLKLRGADPVLVDAIITPSGGRAYGVSVGGTISLEKVVEQFTEDHEIFHQIFANFQDMRLFKNFNKEELMAEAKDLYGDISESQLEEEMAKDFQQYVNQVENGRPTTFFGKIAEFFQKLLASIKRIFRNESDIKAFYRTIYQGQAQEETVINNEMPEVFNQKIKDGVLDFRIQNDVANFLQETPVSETFTDSGDLTLKTITKLEGRKTVSKQFILDSTNSGGITQPERDLIRALLETEGQVVNVQEFVDKVKAELLPLKTTSSKNVQAKLADMGITHEQDMDGQGYFIDKNGDYLEYDELPQKAKDVLSNYSGAKYENIALPSELRGNVKNYSENVYQSPIKTSAGNVHFSDLANNDNYFGHTRIEDMGNGNLRRVIEVQSDLYQKGNLENEKITQKWKKDLSSVKSVKTPEKRLKEIAKLEQYNNPTAHFRMVREEIKKSAEDGKIKLQFPTGETAMKIEGLGGSNTRWSVLTEKGVTGEDLKPEMLEVGMAVTTHPFGIATINNSWVVTDVLGDGKFKAVPKNNLDKDIENFGRQDLTGQLPDGNYYSSLNQETFDISGKVDTTNPIYRFYEKDLARYLKNNYNAVPVTDENGVTWYEVPIQKAYGDLPVPAFNTKPQFDENGEPVIYIDQEEEAPTPEKFPVFEDLRDTLKYAEKRVGMTKADQEQANKEITQELFNEAQQVNQQALEIFSTKENQKEFKKEVEQEKEYQEYMKIELDNTRAKPLYKYANHRNGTLGEVLGGPDVKGRWAKHGDDIAAELGFESSEDAREAYEKYAEKKKNFIERKKELSQKVKNFNEKKNVLDYLESKIRKEGRERANMVKTVQDFFNLTDKEMNTIKGNRRDYRFMSEKEFNNFLKAVQGKAWALDQHKNAILEIEHTIFELELRKVDNLRLALNMKKLENMSILELQKFNNLLQTYQRGDEFLGKRRIQTAALTDLGNITTSREAKEKLAKEAGVPIEDLNGITVSEVDQFLYDPAFARKNPLYKVMVDNVNRATVEAGQRFDAVRKDIQNLMTIARKSRKRSIGQKLVPTDEMIFNYLSATSEEKIKLAQDMTPAEIAASLYIQEKYAEIRDYLINQKTLTKYRENYITHIRRSFLEALKESGTSVFTRKGFTGLIKELFDNFKQEKAAFNILDEKTGEVLALEKFFRFSMQRSDNLIPSKNVAKAFLEYVRTFEKKRQLDSFVPKIDIFTHVLTPQQTTEKGLIKNDTLSTFVKKWLNSKKGRVDKILFAPGSTVDTFVRAGIAVVRIIDLGLNIPVGLASNFGAQGSTIIPLGARKYTIGVTRRFSKQGKSILAKHESMVGETFWHKMQDASKNIGDKTNEILFGLFSEADRNAKSVYLLGVLTPQEYKTGEISPERLAQIRNDMGKFHIMDNMESVVGKTAVGKIFTQYKKWAVPLIHTTINNLAVVTKTLKNKQNPLKTQEGKELLRSTILTAIVLLLGYKTYDELKKKKNKSFLENLAYKSMNDALSIMGALSPSLWTTSPRLIQWIGDLSTSLTNIAISLSTGSRTAEGKIEGSTVLKSTVIPRAIRNITGKDSTTEEIDASLNKTSSAAEKELESIDSNIVEPAKEVWDQVKKLGVGTPEADTLVDTLTDNEYEAYKQVKKADLKYWENMANKVTPVVDEAFKLGFGTPEADALVNDLTDSEYDMYKKIKEIKYSTSDTGEVSKWDSLSFVEKAGNLIKGWTHDPITAFDNLIHGGEYKIVELRNGQIIVERMPENASEAIKKQAAKDNKNYKLDHIVPLKSGGTNRTSNLEIVPTEIWAQTTEIENYLSKALKDEKITDSQAREYIIRYKASQDRQLTPEIQKEFKNKYDSKPLTYEEIQQLVEQ